MNDATSVCRSGLHLLVWLSVGSTSVFKSVRSGSILTDVDLFRTREAP